MNANWVRLSLFACGLILGSATSSAVTEEPIYNPDTHSYYELIDVQVTWAGARNLAATMTYAGRIGRLVVIETAAENLFLTDAYTADGLHLHWIGGYQIDGSDEPDGGWMWITGEPMTYANWNPGEPNNLGDENAVVFDHGVGADGKYWNDVHDANSASGFVVEYPELIVATESSSWSRLRALY